MDAETGQTILSGMGELHLEIIHDRLRRDFGVDCSLGKLQVSYKEQPTVSISQRGEKGLSIHLKVSIVNVSFPPVVSLDRTVGSKHHAVSMTLELMPTSNDSSHSKPSVHLDLAGQRHEEQMPGGFSKAELLEALQEGVEGGCLQGMCVMSAVFVSWIL